MTPNNKLKFDNFITLDLEYTSWKGSLENNWGRSFEKREIVQIGIYHPYLRENNISFYFEPKINKKLSNYFVNLTKITNEFLKKHSIEFIDGLERIEKITQNIDSIYVIGKDKEVILENIKIYNIQNNYTFIDKIIDIRPYIANKLKLSEKQIISSELPNLLKFKITDENKHNAEYDSFCTFKAIELIFF